MKKHLIYFLCFVIIGAVVFSGCNMSHGIRLRIKNDQILKLGRGQILGIELESNPTTGYSWFVTSKTSNILMQQGDSQYVESAPRIGAGGIQLYSFKAVNKGKTDLVFEYKRPWETKSAEKYIVEVTVQ